MLASSVAGKSRDFRNARSGNVVIMFGLALVPLIFMIGAAVDYTRASENRGNLQAAVDATALSLAREPPATPVTTLQAKGDLVFAANYHGDTSLLDPLVVTVAGEQLNVSVKNSVQTSLLSLAGLHTIAVGAATQVAFVTTKLEVALALDNTGSMAQNGKIAALKVAAHSLVDTLQRATSGPNIVRLSVIPFNTQVNIGTGNRNASWLRYDTSIENPNYHADRFPPSVSSWQGCIADRDQSFDTLSDAPAARASNYVAAECEFPGLQAMLPLSNNFPAISTEIDGMQPVGATNVTIGLTTALASLRPTNPLGATSSTASETMRFVVLMSDGANTENRFVGNGMDGNADAPQVDARMRLACQAAQPLAIEIFTIVLNAPDSTHVMRDCASSPGNAFNVVNPADLQPTFNQIAKMIFNRSIRLAK